MYNLAEKQKHHKLLHLESNIVSSVAKIYQKTEESMSKDVQDLQKWMQSQDHLPEILDDKSVQNFLILNKCRIDQTKEKIDMYYTFRSQLPELAENMNPDCSNIKEVAKLIYHVPLPKLTEDMYRVFVNKCRNKDKVDQIEPYDILRMVINLQEIRLKEDVMFGDVFIFDMEGTSMGYLPKLTPTFTVGAITLFKIHVCKDASILKEHFPLEILPRDYGGKEKSVEKLHGLCQLKFQEYQDRFDLLDKLRVNETLRPKI